MMDYTFCSQTDAGQVRQNNEDAVAFDEVTRVGVLADGMGGYNAGEIASGMATAFIQTELSRWLTDAGPDVPAAQLKRAIEVCVQNANRSIFNASSANAHFAGMGTTLVVGVFHEQRLWLGHVGDSRCYRLRGQQYHRITRDHSLLQEQLDAGLLTPEQAAQSPHRNLVTRALGVEESVELELHAYAVAPGDLYLMCSDGLSDMVSDHDQGDILRRARPLAQMADELVSLANAHGGRDNISVLLVQVSGASEKRGLISRWLGN